MKFTSPFSLFAFGFFAFFAFAALSTRALNQESAKVLVQAEQSLQSSSKLLAKYNQMLFDVVRKEERFASTLQNVEKLLKETERFTELCTKAKTRA